MSLDSVCMTVGMKSMNGILVDELTPSPQPNVPDTWREAYQALPKPRK